MVQMPQIPILDFTQDLIEGSAGWKDLSDKVREACEGYGCFQVVYDKVPTNLKEEMFKLSEDLFDLPDETKMKNIGSQPYYGYLGKLDVIPLHEGLGIEDAPSLEAAGAFTELMWPDGNPKFCQTVNSLSNKLYDLELILLKMIMGSYGVEKHYNSFIANHNTVFRMLKYKAPQSVESKIGLGAHRDKSAMTILCQNSVDGLEVLSKEDNWLRIIPKSGAILVFVGEALKAWSNGRLNAVKHRVMMTGDKARYSFALFSTPKDGLVVEVPEELVDKEHPLLFRPFNYSDFLDYYYSHIDDDNVLVDYAGV